MPTVTTLIDWIGSVAMALVNASAYNERQDVEWWSTVNDPKMCIADLASSGGKRFEHLVAMLADTLKSKVEARSNLRRELTIRMVATRKNNTTLTGRQVAYIVCHALRATMKMPSAYGVSDLMQITWLGDDPDQVKNRWDKICDNFDAGSILGHDSARQTLLG